MSQQVEHRYWWHGTSDHLHLYWPSGNVLSFPATPESLDFWCYRTTGLQSVGQEESNIVQRLIFAALEPAKYASKRLKGTVTEWTTKLVTTWKIHTMTNDLAKNEISNLREFHLKIKFHFWKQLVKFIFKEGNVIKSSVSALTESFTSSCSAKVGRDMLGHLAKCDDRLLPLGYCAELFKELESFCWVETSYRYCSGYKYELGAGDLSQQKPSPRSYQVT